MVYLVGGTIEGKNVLFVGKDGSFTGSENFQEAKNLLPNLNTYHKTDVTWSTSASLWWITFQPKLVEFKDLQEVETALLDRNIKKYTSSFGSITATPLKDDYVIRVAEKGSLIDERFNTAKKLGE